MARRPVRHSFTESVLGDLLAERRRRATGSPVRAALWFWSQVLAIGMHLVIGHAALAARTSVEWLRSVAAGAGRELRHAFRSLLSAPWFAAAVIGVLTLCMVLATTVFAVVDGILFKPLPYPRSEELVAIQAGFRAVNGSVPLRPWLSALDVSVWRGAVPEITFTIFRTGSSTRFVETNEPPLAVADVEPPFFDVIGVRPLIGGFSPDHFAETSTAGAAIISHQLWRDRFGGAPDIVGQRVIRGTASMEIVGVLPPDFVFPARQNAQVLRPLRLSASERTNPGFRAFEVIARVPPAATLEATRERLEAVGAADRIAVQPLDAWLSSRPRALFVAVSASVGALVLLGCVNVSGLMAARSLDRRREIDLRRALGARASHIAAIVLAEAGLLVTAGTLLGIALAIPFLRLAMDLLPADLTLLKIPAIDWRVAAFAGAATSLSVAGISVWPIRRGLRATGTATLAGASRGTPRARSAGRFVVVSSQIAIGLALTVGGTLLVGSLVRLRQDDIGIDARDVLAIELAVPASAASSRPDGAEGILTRVLDGIRSIPGVVVAGATDAPLLRNMTWKDDGWIPPAGASRTGYLNVHGITSGFFDVVRPRLLAGRLPSNEELDAGRHVVVVSQSIANAFWPNRPAIGETLEYTLGSRAHFSVVGVVADARFAGWDEDRFHQIYAPLTALRRGSSAPNVLMRTAGSTRVLADMHQFMSAEGTDVRAIRAMPLTAMLADTVRWRRFQSWFFGSFAAAALAIVGVGVLGLMAMTAARRTREIGLRMALGATRDAVGRMFVREQVAAVATGIIAGALIAAWAAKFLRTYLYGLTPYDARIWILAILLAAGTAMIGTLIPALRASRIDPAKALRAE